MYIDQIRVPYPWTNSMLNINYISGKKTSKATFLSSQVFEWKTILGEGHRVRVSRGALSPLSKMANETLRGEVTSEGDLKRGREQSCKSLDKDYSQEREQLV